ncbi:hypothetical protein FDUTEX481_05296 [Tolypothrix sp. PCC 7601]|nr:hypothetical protein FDUTEX481_05296 [Tolypothrix sp. PCC 7601]
MTGGGKGKGERVMGKGKEKTFNRSADAHGVREQRPAGKPFPQNQFWVDNA